MEEPVRLVCPDCQLVYRVKHLKLGKRYSCRSCGGDLRSLEPVRLCCPSCGAAFEESDFSPSTQPRCQLCDGAPPLILPSDYESTIANANLDASSSAQTAITGGPRPAAAAPRQSGSGDLARLPGLIGELTARLDELRRDGVRTAGERGENDERILAATADLAAGLAALDEKIGGDLQGLDVRIAALLDKIDAGPMPELAERIRETGDRLAAQLEEFRQARQSETGGRSDAPAGAQIVEMDLDDLAERLISGMRLRAPRLDDESGSAVDALVRVADELIKEQGANTHRLDQLAGEIKAAASGLQEMDEWRGALPARVADEIGRTVEERVVGPLSGALARQAPAILSDLQDNKLVDIVSRSVREAQRPLLREILSGGAKGVPPWLFAAVLIPLLLILGYLFLPGALGFGNDSERLAYVAEAVERIEQSGAQGAPDTGDRLAAIEEIVTDIHGEAMAHARNAATLEEEVRNLKRELERNQLLQKEYEKALETQTRRVRAYESRLNRLGVVPDTIPD